MPCQAVAIWFQVLFTPNQMGSFQHSLAVLNTLSVLRNIQNWKSMPPKKKIHAQFPMNATQETNKTKIPQIYGTITLYG